MSIEISASKLPDVMGTYRRLSHTVLSCIVSCVHTAVLSKMFDVGDRDLPVPTSGNWVIKGWVIKWPVKLRTFFYVFFKIKKHDFLRFFRVADHVFSNTGNKCSAETVPNVTGHHITFWRFLHKVIFW